MVSVCMATYNGEKYIYKQINSILSQLSIFDELIISDDKSSDATIQIAESFRDQRIKIFINKNKKGVIVNFQNAVSMATGDYIFLSDQDDVWKLNRVEIGLNLLKSNVLVVCDAEIIDENDNVVLSSMFSQKSSGPGIFKNFYKNTYHGCCMCFRREILNLALPFPPSIPMHDIWLGFIAELFFKSCFTQAKLIQYRRHNHNITYFLYSKVSFIKKIQFRFNLIRYLPLLYYRRLFFLKNKKK